MSKKQGQAYKIPKPSLRVPKAKRSSMAKRNSLMLKRLKHNPFPPAPK